MTSSGKDHLRLVTDDEATRLLEDLRARVAEVGGFIAFRKPPEVDGCVPVAASLELTTENESTIWCLSFEPDLQFMVREDDIFRAMAAHHMKRLEREDCGDTDQEDLP